MRLGITGSISSLLVFLVVCGCGHSLPLDGDWVGDMGLKAQPGQDPSVAVTLSKISLHFNGSGRFELLFRGVFYKGDVKPKEKDADLAVDTVINVAPSSPITFRAKPTEGVIDLTDPEGNHFKLKPKMS